MRDLRIGITTIRGVDRLAKILIASFDSAQSADIGSIFRRAGYYVRETKDLNGFLAAIQAEAFDAAIIDGVPGDFSGGEFSLKLGAYPYFPCIFLAADADERMFGEALRAGAYAYLVKPAEPLRLLFIVRSALQNSLTLTVDRHPSSAREALDEDPSKAIDTVTGLLMERFGLGQQDAFERLRRYARSQRVKIADVAQRILAASDQSNKLMSALNAATDGGVETRGRVAGAALLKKSVVYKPVA